MEEQSSEHSNVGMQFISGFWRRKEYLLFVDGCTVRATPGPDRWFSSSSDHQWDWLDGRKCRVEASDWFSATTLSVNGELTYQMAGLPLHLGLSWIAAIRLRQFELEWRRVADGSHALTVEVKFSGGWKEYSFLNDQGERIGRFEQRERWRCRDGKRGAMPLQGFRESSKEELLLAWAFIVSVESPRMG